MPRVRDFIIKLLKFAVAGGLIFWMVQKGLLDLSVLADLLTPQSIIICLLIGLLSILLISYRWWLLLKVQKLPVGYWQTCPLTLIGIFFNFAIPGAIGGDVVKAFYIAQDHRERRLHAVTTVVMDRVIGLFGMVILAMAAICLDLPLVFENIQIFWIAVSTFVLFVLMSLFFIFALSSRLYGKNLVHSFAPRLPLGLHVIKVYEAIHSYRAHSKTLLACLALSVGIQIVAVLFMVYIGYAMGEWGEVPLLTYFFAAPLGFIIAAIPVTPGGLGVGQVAFLALFQVHSGVQTEIGQTGVTAFQVVMLLWGLIGAYFYAQRKKPVLNEVSA